MKKYPYLCKKFENMTDKEKIELIIQDKHLNNTQFCNEVCIAAGTLSHILSGRTAPTLNILRSVAMAFPDINPAWLFYGEEPMYKNVDSPTREDVEEVGATHINNNIDEDRSLEDGGMPLFAFSPSAAPSSSSAPSALSRGNVSRPAASSPASKEKEPAHQAGHAVQYPAALSVQEIVAETLRQQQKPQRKVSEVRIYFDDGTFETFGTK